MQNQFLLAQKLLRNDIPVNSSLCLTFTFLNTGCGGGGGGAGIVVVCGSAGILVIYVCAPTDRRAMTPMMDRHRLATNWPRALRRNRRIRTPHADLTLRGTGQRTGRSSRFQLQKLTTVFNIKSLLPAIFFEISTTTKLRPRVTIRPQKKLLSDTGRAQFL